MRRWASIGTGLTLAAVLAASAPAVATENTRPKLDVAVTKFQGDPRFVFQWKRETAYAIEHKDSDWTIRFQRPAAVDAKRLAAKAPNFKPRVSETASGVTVTLKLPEGMRLRDAKSGASVVVDVVPAPKSHPEAKTAEAKPAEAKPAAKPAEPAPNPKPADAKPVSPAAEVLRVRAAAIDGGTQLRFEWPKPVAGAAWRRGGRLFVAFDMVQALDLSELRGKDGVLSAETVANDRATVLRLAIADGLNPTLARSGNVWSLELRAQGAKPEAPIAVDVQAAAQPSRVVFALRDPAAALTVGDPELGDTLLVVPTAELGQGLPRAQAFVDFQALASIQGLVLRPIAEGLTVRPSRGAVEVTGIGGLVLSPTADRMLRTPGDAVARLFDFKAWGAAPEEHKQKRRALEQAAAAAPADARTAPRLDLARFYFAQGMAPEATGVLLAIERDDAAAANDKGFHALRGAAAFLEGDGETAQRELGHRSLGAEPEAALWRAALAAASGDWPAASKGFTAGAPILPSYPKRLRHRFALMAAEAALRAGPKDAAQPLIAYVLGNEPDPASEAAAKLLAGYAKRDAGDAEAAIALWDEVAAGRDTRAAARAGYERAIAKLDTGRMSRADAIQALESVRFAWRGDELEAQVLRKLADLRLAEGDPRGAFDTLRQIASVFADTPTAQSAQKQLSDALAEMFLGKEAEKLPPLKALALFDENRDAVMASPRGDEVVRHLSERLAAVDLLDRAAGLLEPQVKTRLAGAEQAKAANQLALMRLIDRKPDAALAALNLARDQDLPADIAGQRRMLRARTLLELDRREEALAALQGDNSREAEKVRGQIYWRGQQWAEAAKSFATLAAAPGADGKVDDETSRIVLNWAAALTLAGDPAGLGVLRQKYGPAMERSPNRDAFRVMSGGNIDDGDVRKLAGSVAQVSDLRAMLSGFRSKPNGTQKISAAN